MILNDLKRITSVKTMRCGVLCIFTLLFCLTPAAAADREVDVELLLAVDVSRSMNFEELEIQRKGYAAALRDDEVIEAMLSGLIGRVAITFLEWAGNGNQRTVVPWREIASREDAEAFADSLLSDQSFSMRYTSISGAILSGIELFEGNGFSGLKRVIDISGDGPNNQGVPVERARDKAIDAGIIINGLPLMTTGDAYSRYSIPNLDEYYIDCVIGGPGSFSLPVRSWQEFPEAVRRKLVLELAGRDIGQPERRPTAVTPISIEGKPLKVVAGEREKVNCMIGEILRRQWDAIFR